MCKENRIEAKDGDVCLITNKGYIVMEPKTAVDALYYPSHGFCQIERKGKFGYIDMTGELVIPCKYQKAYPFSENGLAFVVCENGLGGYIDEHDNFVIEPIYETGSPFKFGMAAVSSNGEYQYIYKNGCKAIDHTFKYASGFSECGLSKTHEFNDKQGLMDTRSRIVLTLKKGCELAEFKEDSRITKFTMNGREALINAAGEIITGFYDRIVISPYSRLNPFLKDGLWGYIDKKGNEAIPNSYQEVSEFTEEKTAHVKAFHPFAENSSWSFYINEEDKIIEDEVIENNNRKLNRQYIHVNRFKKCLALAVKKNHGNISLRRELKMNVQKDNNG